MFAWQQYENNIQKKASPESRTPSFVISGVENTNLYRDNLKTYRELLFRRDKIQVALNPIRAKLATEASRILSPELWDFLKERNRRKEGKYQAATMGGDPQLEAYIRFLRKQVSKTLKIDFTDPIE